MNINNLFSSTNLASGLVVALIALPLSMGIAMASGCPPVAGLLTAIVGGLVTGWLGGSPLTIKGPAAGLIVIILGAVQDFAIPADPMAGYRAMLAIGVAAGVVQVVLGMLRLGVLAEYMPTSVVHGMLAAIGVIIFGKQIHVMMGVTPSGKDPIALLLEIPQSLMHANPKIMLIGLVALAIMFIYPKVVRGLSRLVPASLVVLFVAVGLSSILEIGVLHNYSFLNHSYQVSDAFLVQVPNNLLASIIFPDFSVLTSMMAWKHVVLFTVIGSIESLLTVSAVNSLDKQGIKGDLNTDLFAVGVGNIVSACIGGLPMISEVVRSKVNVDMGAKSWTANTVQSLALLLSLTLFPSLLELIPVAALAAILVYVGIRLASPREFSHMAALGYDQFALFFVTCVLTVWIDLLVGVGVGFLLAIGYLRFNSQSLRNLFSLRSTSVTQDDSLIVKFAGPLVFTNRLKVRNFFERARAEEDKLVFDFSEASIIEHGFLDGMHSLKKEYPTVELQITGMGMHRPIADHPCATRLASEG